MMRKHNDNLATEREDVIYQPRSTIPHADRNDFIFQLFRS